MENLNQSYINFKRLHPLTLAYRAIANLPGLAIPIYFAMQRRAIDDYIYLIILILSGSLYLFFLLPYNILHYRNFKYKITEKEIKIESGVFSKKYRNIAIARVQNISTTQNFLQRILKIVKVEIETAGESTTEGNLEFVSSKDSDEIREIIRQYQASDIRVEAEDVSVSESDVDVDESTEPEEKSKSIYSVNFKYLIFHGLLKFRPIVLIGMFSVFQYYMVLNTSFMNFDENSIRESLNSLSIFDSVEFVLIGLVLAIFLSWILNSLLTINKYFGFTLNLENNKLYTKYGLLTKKQGTIPIKKLQSISIVTNFISRYFGFYGLECQTAGVGDTKRSAELAVPIDRLDNLKSISENLFDYVHPDNFNPVSRKTIRRALVRYSFLSLCVGVILFSLLPNGLWIFILSPMLYFGARLKYQYRGYYLDDDHVIIKQGFIFERITVIPIKKIQTLNIIESFFQRRLKLSTLNIDTAGTFLLNDASIIDIAREDAEEILSQIDTKFRASFK